MKKWMMIEALLWFVFVACFLSTISYIYAKNQQQEGYGVVWLIIVGLLIKSARKKRKSYNSISD
jgi:uncharacterized membrane-anchored protein